MQAEPDLSTGSDRGWKDLPHFLKCQENRRQAAVKIEENPGKPNLNGARRKSR